MNIIVFIKQVPDLVEELFIDGSGKYLDRAYMKYIINESDDHALEQALLLKEKYGGNVTVFAIDYGEVDETLFMSLAKGADKVFKVIVNDSFIINSHSAAKIFHSVLQQLPFDIILTGVQSIEDVDGQIGALLAGYMHLPYIGVVNSIQFDGTTKSIRVKKEFSGGVLSEMEIKLPALIGIQAAEKPPRYIPISKIRQAQKNGSIEIIKMNDNIDIATNDKYTIRKMFTPETGKGAEMLEGTNDIIVNKLIQIFSEKGIKKSV